jgi:hypothetical protein
MEYIFKVEKQNKQINNQCPAMRREFEHVGPTLLKNPLGASWVYYLPCNGCAKKQETMKLS